MSNVVYCAVNSDLISDAELNYISSFLPDDRLKKAENLAGRAPMVIGVVAKLDPTIKKVPEWEQLLCAGCATYAMQLAANALGFKNVWISGPWLEGSALRNAFQCKAQDKIIGFIMLGSGEEKLEREKKVLSLDDVVSSL